MRLLMRNAEPVSPTREVRRRLVAHDCMTNNDSLEVPSLHPYVYIKDHLGSVRLTVDAIASNTGTGNARQNMEYLPSGYVFRSDNYAEQPYMFCGKELVKMHGINLYDSNARFQHKDLPRFTSMDPLAEWDFATSPYAYCQNDFVNLVDPWGLFPTWEEAHQASLNHPGSHVRRDWNTGNYFYYFSVDSDEAVTVHREFGLMGNPYDFGRPYIGNTYSSYYLTHDIYGGGGGGGSRRRDSGLITKPIEITSALGSRYYEIKASLEYNEKTETWRGKNGKTYKGLKGKGPNQYTGSRDAARDRAKVLSAKADSFSKIGRGMMFLGVAYDIYEGKYYKAGARFITNYAIEATSGIPYVGPYVFLGLAVSEAFWGNDFYDWVQESLE